MISSNTPSGYMGPHLLNGQVVAESPFRLSPLQTRRPSKIKVVSDGDFLQLRRSYWQSQKSKLSPGTATTPSMAIWGNHNTTKVLVNQSTPESFGPMLPGSAMALGRSFLSPLSSGRCTISMLLNEEDVDPVSSRSCATEPSSASSASYTVQMQTATTNGQKCITPLRVTINPPLSAPPQEEKKSIVESPEPSPTTILGLSVTPSPVDSPRSASPCSTCGASSPRESGNDSDSDSGKSQPPSPIPGIENLFAVARDPLQTFLPRAPRISPIVSQYARNFPFASVVGGPGMYEPHPLITPVTSGHKRFASSHPSSGRMAKKPRNYQSSQDDEDFVHSPASPDDDDEYTLFPTPKRTPKRFKVKKSVLQSKPKKIDKKGIAPSDALEDEAGLEYQVSTLAPDSLAASLRRNPEIWALCIKPKKGFYSCSHCWERFRTMAAFAIHIDQHQISREYACFEDTCPWSLIGFSKRSELTRHVKCQHALEPSSCPYCGKEFGRKDSMKRHIDLVHFDKGIKKRKKKRVPKAPTKKSSKK